MEKERGRRLWRRFHVSGQLQGLDYRRWINSLAQGEVDPTHEGVP